MPVARAATWTDPITFTDGTLLDEDTMNQQVRNNVLFLKEGGHLSIVTLTPSTTAWGTPSHSITAATGWAAIDTTYLKVLLTVAAAPTTQVLLGFMLPVDIGAAAAQVAFDWYDGTNFVSSGTGTPAANGAAIYKEQNANYGIAAAAVLPATQAVGTTTWTLYWKGIGGTAAMHIEQFPAQLWAMKV